MPVPHTGALYSLAEVELHLHLHMHMQHMHASRRPVPLHRKLLPQTLLLFTTCHRYDRHAAAVMAYTQSSGSNNSHQAPDWLARGQTGSASSLLGSHDIAQTFRCLFPDHCLQCYAVHIYSAPDACGCKRVDHDATCARPEPLLDKPPPQGQTINNTPGIRQCYAHALTALHRNVLCTEDNGTPVSVHTLADPTAT